MWCSELAVDFLPGRFEGVSAVQLVKTLGGRRVDEKHRRRIERSSSARSLPKLLSPRERAKEKARKTETEVAERRAEASAAIRRRAAVGKAVQLVAVHHDAPTETSQSTHSIETLSRPVDGATHAMVLSCACDDIQGLPAPVDDSMLPASTCANIDQSVSELSLIVKASDCLIVYFNF